MSGDKRNQEEFYQCQQCGTIYKAKAKHTEDGFVKLWCDYCRESTIQLNIGEQDEIYLYLNINLDNRYY